VPPGRLGVRIFALVANGLADSKEKGIYRNIFTLTRIWRVTIQNLLIAALQNLRKLLSAVKRKPKRANCMEFLPVCSAISENFLALAAVSISIFRIISDLSSFLMSDGVKIEKMVLVSDRWATAPKSNWYYRQFLIRSHRTRQEEKERENEK